MQETFFTNPQEIRRFLSSTDLFNALEQETFHSVEKELEWLALESGDILTRQGEPGECLFVLVSGRLRVFINRENGSEEPVGEISPGESVGEMAIIGEEPRSATVRAVRASVLVRLTRTGFDRLASHHPEIMKHMARLLVQRLRRVSSRTERRKRPLTVGVVLAGESQDLLSNFARYLTDALSRLDSTCHMSQATVDKEYRPGFAEAPLNSTASIKLSNWLSERERSSRFVVYEAAAPESVWTHRVIRQSDRILIVALADGPPPPNIGALIAASGVNDSAARKDLVLVHSGTKREISGTAEWLQAVNGADCYHVSLYSMQDFERLARIVAGRSIGLVLGGGGARGFAHIGVIRALGDAGIPVDFIGGTNIGALIAAEHALTWTPDQMLEETREVFRRYPLHGDAALPIVSATTPHRALRLFELLFQDTRIEDQWLNYFAVSCNLTRGEIVVHREGRFRDCVEASSALPGLNCPIDSYGELIVDGAVINNLPADVMQKLSGGRVIAVDVTPRRDLQNYNEKDSRTSRDAREGARIVRPGRQSTATLPNAQNIIMRTIVLNSMLSAQSMNRHIDCYLEPPVGEIDMFDWMKIDAAAEIGYRYAAGKLEKARAMLLGD